MDQQQQEQLRYLFARYANNLSTKAEYEAFLEIVSQSESDEELKAIIDQLWAELDEQPQTNKRNRPFIYKLIPYGIAAATLIGVAIGYVQYQKSNIPNTTAELISPIQKGVTLKLANGQTLQLSKKYKGQVTKTATQTDSLLTYNNSEPAEEKNTLTNNGNDKFSITLSDGTQAILDINSSLTYPTAFNKTREVTLTGQAYFKVKHKSSRFIIHYSNTTTEDLGTEFNIEAYANPTTTLVEGSIKVNNKTLKPGQQITADNISTADLDETLAWLQDRYVFNNEPLENIMTWVSRIYGVQIIYQNEQLKHQKFGGSFNRKKKLASVLNFFRQTGGIDFKVEGNTVTIFKSPSNMKKTLPN